MKIARSTKLLLQAALFGGASLFFMGTALADSSTSPANVSLTDTVTKVVNSAPGTVVTADTTNNDKGGSGSVAADNTPGANNSGTAADAGASASVSAQTTQSSDSATVVLPTIAGGSGGAGGAVAPATDTPAVVPAADNSLSAPAVEVSAAVHQELVAMADSSVDTHSASVSSPVSATDFSALAATASSSPASPAAPNKAPARPLGAVGQILAILASARIPAIIGHGLATSVTAFPVLTTTMLASLVFGSVLGFIFSFGFWLRSTGYLSASRDGLPQLSLSFFATPYRLGYVSASAPFA